jgi:hypothetical protein
MNNKALKQLKKAYNTRLKLLNDKKFLEDVGAGILILVEKLRYLRDRLIVEEACITESEPEVFEDPFAEFSEKTVLEEPLEAECDIITSLILALAEFDAYQQCNDEKQRDFHFNAFWELVKINMEEWLALNDTV